MNQGSFMRSLLHIAQQDVEGLIEARRAYGDSWRAEGGFSAFFNVKRKIDRFVNLMKRDPIPGRERFDLFGNIKSDVAAGGEATLDAVRDLRRYLMLAEAWLVESGTDLPLARDNATLENSGFFQVRELHIRRVEISAEEMAEDILLNPSKTGVLFDPPKQDDEGVCKPMLPSVGPGSAGRLVGGDRDGQDCPYGFDPNLDSA